MLHWLDLWTHVCSRVCFCRDAAPGA